MDLAESVAKYVVESIIPGARMTFCERQSDSECDFDLLLPSGDHAALEVTAAADAAYLATLAAIDAPRHGGHFVQAVHTRATLYVHPVMGARIQTIRRDIDSYIAAVEATGLRQFFAAIHASEYEPVRRIADDLGIECGQLVSDAQPSRIILASPGRGYLLESDALLLALESEAAKPDNVRKLRGSPGPERHLFVFVDMSSRAAWGAMLAGIVPSRVPVLPDGISHAWLASSGGVREHGFRTLRFDHCARWQDFGDVLAPLVARSRTRPVI